MREPRKEVTAYVKVGMTVRCGSSWSPSTTLEQIHKQAEDEVRALFTGIVTGLPARVKMTSIHVETVTAQLTEGGDR